MPELARTAHHDPFSPTLYSSEPLEVSEEQRQYIWEICETAASDSRFAEKAYAAILVILTRGSVEMPVVESLNPFTATLGTPSFTLSVRGTGFGPQSKIVWNGGIEPTVYVSETELTTDVNMDTAVNAIPVSVSVQNEDGSLSNSVTFTFLPSIPATMATSTAPVKK